MPKRLEAAFLLACGCASFVLFTGCNRSDKEQPAKGGESKVAEHGDDYNPHDVPITEEQKAELRKQTAEFPQAVKMMESLRDSVEKETAAGIPENPYKVHQALDRADLVLQWLPEIARDSGVAKTHWETINTTASDMRTLFEQVHQNVDNKQDPNFGAVAGDLDQKLTALEEIATAEKQK